MVIGPATDSTSHAELRLRILRAARSTGATECLTLCDSRPSRQLMVDGLLCCLEKHGSGRGKRWTPASGSGGGCGPGGLGEFRSLRMR